MKLRKLLVGLVFISFILMMTACLGPMGPGEYPGGGNPGGDATPTAVVTAVVSATATATPASNTGVLSDRFFWGTWVRMDKDEVWYIRDKGADIGAESKTVLTAEKSSISLGDTAGSAEFTLLKDSNDVIKVTESGGAVYYLFRKAGKNSTFNGRLASFVSAKGIGLGGLSNISVILQNTQNPSDTQTVTTTDGGGFSATEVIAGDEYEIVTDDNQNIPVEAEYSGQNIGTVVTDSPHGYNFKTKISSTSDYLYADLSAYEVKIEMENIGTADCFGASYAISSNDLTIVGTKAAILGTVEQNSSKTITVSARHKLIETEYADPIITVTITDANGYVWTENITLRFWKKAVSINVASTKAVNFMVITPDRVTHRYECSGTAGKTVYVPWRTSDYHIAFSGATIDSEATYSVGFNTEANTSFDGFLTTSAFEPNNHEYDSAVLSDGNSSMAFLHKNDMDFYRVNFSGDLELIKPVIFSSFGDYDVNGNRDSIPSPGETILMTPYVKNVSTVDLENINIELSSLSQYVTITDNNMTIASLKQGAQSVYSDGSFTYSIESSCPKGTLIPFTLNFHNSLGNRWTETFDVNVSSVDIAISIDQVHVIDDLILANMDNSTNPGETMRVDIAVKNTGLSNGKNITGILSSTSSYVTLVDDNFTFGDIGGGKLQSVASKKSNPGSIGFSTVTLNGLTEEGFAFTVSPDCPDYNMVLPFKLTCTDAYGKSWSDTFEVPVRRQNVSIGIDWTSIKAESFDNNGNSDTYCNPGETVRIDYSLKNSGTSKVMGLKGVLTTTSSYATITDNNFTYGNIKGGMSQSIYSKSLDPNSEGVSSPATTDGFTAEAFTFNISPDCPPDSRIYFVLTCTDKYGNYWTRDVSVYVSRLDYKPSYSYYDINSTAARDKGWLDVRIFNSGSNVAGVTAKLSTTSSYITMQKDTYYYGNFMKNHFQTIYYKENGDGSSIAQWIPPNAGADGVFTFDISSDCPADYLIPFKLECSDKWGNQYTTTFNARLE